MADESKDSRGEARLSFLAKQQLIESARTAFQQLSAVIRNATLYPGAHPVLLAAADKFRGTIEELTRDHDTAAFSLVGGELFFDTLSVPVDQALSLFLEQCGGRKIGRIVIRPGLTSQELIRFAGLMNNEAAFAQGDERFTDVLVKSGIDHIELYRVLPADKKAKEEAKTAGEIYHDAVDAVKEMVRTIHLNKVASGRKMTSMVHMIVDNVLDNPDALMGLTSLKMYDEYTFAHSVNTAILAVSLGAFLSFDKPRIAALGTAALMHDIGKVSIPHEIINKPGKLTDEEWDQVKRHPVEGALFLSGIPTVSKLAMVAAFEHHQHGDVRGYPQVPGTLEQHPFSQIVALADAYEAVTARRVYYSVQTPPDHAVRILIAKRGTAFNPVLVKAFVNMIGLFPIGTIVKLDTDEIGLVVHQTSDLMRPRVLLLSSFDGSEKESGAEVSLLETKGGRYTRSVTGTIDPNAAKIDVKQYLG